MTIINTFTAGGFTYACPNGHELTPTLKDIQEGWTDCAYCDEDETLPYPKEDWTVTEREYDMHEFAARVSTLRSYVEQHGMPGEAAGYADMALFHAPSECGTDINRQVRREAFEALFDAGLSLKDFVAAMDLAVVFEDDGSDEEPMASIVRGWMQSLQYPHG